MGSDPRVGQFTVFGEWFASCVDGCTCAGGTPESSYIHEPNCGWEPLAKLADVEAALDAHYRKDGWVRVNTRDEGTVGRIADKLTDYVGLTAPEDDWDVRVARAVLDALPQEEPG